MLLVPHRRRWRRSPWHSRRLPRWTQQTPGSQQASRAAALAAPRRRAHYRPAHCRRHCHARWTCGHWTGTGEGVRAWRNGPLFSIVYASCHHILPALALAFSPPSVVAPAGMSTDAGNPGGGDSPGSKQSFFRASVRALTHAHNSAYLPALTPIRVLCRTAPASSRFGLSVYTRLAFVWTIFCLLAPSHPHSHPQCTLPSPFLHYHDCMNLLPSPPPSYIIMNVISFPLV